MRTLLSLIALALALAVPLSAQTADARWSAWLGCWQLVDGKADVCIVPAAEGVSLSTRVENEPALEQTIRPDGEPHPVDEGECRGTQTAEWSQDGQKLFSRADLRCRGEAPRRVSGLAFIGPDGGWLDVQGVDVDGRTTVRVRRYRRAGRDQAAPGAMSAARTPGGTGLSVADISEAHGKVPAAVIEAAVAETGARFPGLRSADLIALEDAGVSDNVLDLMVAQTWPSKFQVERRTESLSDLYPSGFMYPYFWHPGYYGSYRYFYAPFGYPYYAYYAPGFYPGSYYYPGSLVVVGGGTDTPAADGEGNDGRAVNGIGYTRVRTREAAEAEARATAAGAGGPRVRGVASPSGFTQSSGDGGSSSASGAGSPTGSSSGDGGRTAVPR